MDWLTNLPAAVLVDAAALLDALPDYGRAMLAAGLLVVFLRTFELRIAAREIAYGEAYRKTTLCALLALPVLVLQFPDSRMSVLVETLPAATSASHPAWLLVLVAWSIGCSIALGRLIAIRYRTLERERALEPLVDARLQSRLAHWQQRLGIRDTLTLVTLSGATPRYLASRQLVGVPAAALHWPVNVQDVLVIRALCHKQRHHGRWHLLAQIAAASYWPVPWVGRMNARLGANFQLAADRLATSCFQDHIGFDRAWRQLVERLDGQVARPAVNPEVSPDPPPTPGWPTRMLETLRRYANTVARLWAPPAELNWIADRQASKAADLVWADPYDKVFVFVGQAVLFAFLLTGMTLEEIAETPEPDYSLWFEIDWSRDFHRNLNRFEPQALPAPSDEGASKRAN